MSYPFPGSRSTCRVCHLIIIVRHHAATDDTATPDSGMASFSRIRLPGQCVIKAKSKRFGQNSSFEYNVRGVPKFGRCVVLCRGIENRIMPLAMSFCMFCHPLHGSKSIVVAVRRKFMTCNVVARDQDIILVPKRDIGKECKQIFLELAV